LSHIYFTILNELTLNNKTVYLAAGYLHFYFSILIILNPQKSSLFKPRHRNCLLSPAGRYANLNAPMAVTLLKLSGEIDLNEKPNVMARLDPLIDKKPNSLVIDLSHVSYVDSSGLAIFIDALQRVKKNGGTLALAGLQENVKVVFEIAKLDQVFEIYSNLDEALTDSTGSDSARQDTSQESIPWNPDLTL
jgi:anti-sigma B factor antagonist